MDARRAAIATLALDRAAIEAVEALRSAGVPSILLKGRSFAAWLYATGEVRGYTDVDLLVPDDRWGEARAVLADLGYRPYFAARHDPAHASAHGRESDGMSIDLHRTLQGLTAPPQRVWDALAAHTEPMRIGGTDIDVLDEVGRCLGVAVHAGRSDVTGVRARDDLRRAVEVADVATWRAAATLAEEIGGAAAFAAGLATEPSAADLARTLALTTSDGAATLPTRGANTLDRALEADSLGEAARAVVPWLVPNPALLRQVRPIARRGGAGVAVAYVTWPAWLIGRLVAALRSRRSR